MNKGGGQTRKGLPSFSMYTYVMICVKINVL